MTSDGWKLVPVEPTEAMKSAGGHVNSEWLNDDAPLCESRYAMPMDGVWSAMLAAAPAAPQAEPCIGSDPACPCQDGDACHYRDTATTKAWPIPQAEPKRPVIEVITEFDAIGNWCRVALTVDGHRFFMEHCSEHPDDAESFAETLRKALGITGDSDADHG